MARILAICLLFLSSNLCAKDTSRPYQMLISHIEPKGIGYKEGYTSLALFFALPSSCDWTIFWDARGHVFNQGKVAANGGLGVRYRWMSRLYGINSYYDFRQNHANYNQISFGLESLGTRWDFRINGCLPVGKTEKIYKTTFAGIQNHLLYFSKREEFALNCVQVEAVFHLDELKVPLSLSMSPYWMNGHNENAWGGEVRFKMNFFDSIWIEGNASYDHLFKWIGQGRLGVIVPFGPRKKGGCKIALQRVSRREIVPLDQKDFKTPAIHRKTGLPYLF